MVETVTSTRGADVPDGDEVAVGCMTPMQPSAEREMRLTGDDHAASIRALSSRLIASGADPQHKIVEVVVLG